jgi:hypothetical protein
MASRRRHRIIGPNFSAPLSCKVVRLQDHGKIRRREDGKGGAKRQDKAGSFDENAGGKVSSRSELRRER